MQPKAPLRVFLICPDAQLREQISGAVLSLPDEALLSHLMVTYPSGNELARALRTFSPHIVLLSFEQAETAVAVMRFLESEAQGLPVIALNPVLDTARIREAMRAGAREFITPPFNRDQ